MVYHYRDCFYSALRHSGATERLQITDAAGITGGKITGGKTMNDLLESYQDKYGIAEKYILEDFGGDIENIITAYQNTPGSSRDDL